MRKKFDLDVRFVAILIFFLSHLVMYFIIQEINSGNLICPLKGYLLDINDKKMTFICQYTIRNDSKYYFYENSYGPVKRLNSNFSYEGLMMYLSTLDSYDFDYRDCRVESRANKVINSCYVKRTNNGSIDAIRYSIIP